MLADGENVSVRIFEPGDFVATWRSPHAAFLVLDEWVFFEYDTPFGEQVDDAFDVGDFPAEDGASQRGEVRSLRNADLVAAYSHNQRKLIEAYEFAAEGTFVKGLRLVIVFREHKANHLSEHGSEPITSSERR